jgi:ribosome maturation protein SDO1
MEKAIVVRLKKGKGVFEVLTHHGAVEQWRAKKLGWDKVCVADVVFKDSKKGDRCSDAELVEAFGTSDVATVLQLVCEKGEVQQTADDRKKASERRRFPTAAFFSRAFSSGGQAAAGGAVPGQVLH